MLPAEEVATRFAKLCAHELVVIQFWWILKMNLMMFSDMVLSSTIIQQSF